MEQLYVLFLVNLALTFIIKYLLERFMNSQMVKSKNKKKDILVVKTNLQYISILNQLFKNYAKIIPFNKSYTILLQLILSSIIEKLMI